MVYLLFGHVTVTFVSQFIDTFVFFSRPNYYLIVDNTGRDGNQFDI